MPVPLEAYFAKLWSAVAAEPPLWEGGDGDDREEKEVPPRTSAAARSDALSFFLVSFFMTRHETRARLGRARGTTSLVRLRFR